MSFEKFKYIGLLLILFSCKVEPQKINYGIDHCVFCEMTVVDKTHASEYVTKKGKSYIFDSIECMVHKMNQEHNESDLAFILVNDYQNPGQLISAKSATYLITDKIKSPMGANLTAFGNMDKAKKIQQELGGSLYNWQELLTHLK